MNARLGSGTRATGRSYTRRRAVPWLGADTENARTRDALDHACGLVLAHGLGMTLAWASNVGRTAPRTAIRSVMLRDVWSFSPAHKLVSSQCSWRDGAELARRPPFSASAGVLQSATAWPARDHPGNARGRSLLVECRTASPRDLDLPGASGRA